jgi:LPXTG-motif cell wall-anchored protein
MLPLLAVIALAAIWLTSSPITEAQSQQAAVSVGDNFFEPQTLTITAGTTVVWTVVGSRPHTVTSDTGAFNSGSDSSQYLRTGGVFQATFASPGTYPYYCVLHGGPGGAGMSGRIVVQAAQQPTSTPTGTAAATGTPRATSPTPSPGRAPSSGVGLSEGDGPTSTIWYAIGGVALLTLGGGVLAYRRINK